MRPEPPVIVPINPAKLAIPAAPGSYLARKRLARLWLDWTDKKLVLVTAGAGFGKTSFLSAAARSSSRPVVWYSIDETDAGLARFSAHLDAALSRRTEESIEIPDGREAECAHRTLSRMVRALGKEKDGRAVVLDDVHLVGRSREVMQLLEKAICFLPHGSTLILASREPLSVATMKLQSQGAVARLVSDDLKFDAEEAARLYRLHFPGARLDPALGRRIIERTEGWPAGVEILFQAVGRSSGRRIEEALERMSDAGLGWFAFFAEEVLRSLEPDLRRFLTRSSVLPRLDAGLCNRILGVKNSRRLLEDLARRNLFTYPVDEDRTAFRYHHIFRDFLVRQLEHEEGAAAGKLRRRAATVLSRAGAWAEALVVRAEEGDAAAVLHLVEKAGDNLLRSGQHDLIRRALSDLPRSSLDERPAALVVLGRAMEIPGHWEEAEAIYRRALRVCPPGTRRIELMSLTAQIRLRRGDHKGCTALCERALKERGPKPAALRMSILGMLGISACELGRLDEGEDYLKKAISASKGEGGREEKHRTFYLLPGNIHYRRGEFRRAKEAVRSALVVFKKERDSRSVCHSLGVLAHITAETADTRAASELAREGLRMAQSLDYPVMDGYCRLALAKCALIDGDLAEARAHAQAALGAGDLLGEVGLRTISMTRLAEIALVSGDRNEAARLANAALDVSVRLRDIYQESENCILLGVLDAKKGRGNASRWWRRSERIIRRVGMRYHLHRLLLIRLAAGDVLPNGKTKALRELLRGAASLDHSFLFLALERERAVPVLCDAVRWGAETDYAARMLVEIGENAVSHIVPLLQDRDESVSVRAVDLLARIGGDEARA
jgi:ATP/maltotriose-dependent transcriptional regulator MalT